MSGAALLNAVISRIESFLLEESSPAECGYDFLDDLETLVSDKSSLRILHRLVKQQKDDFGFNKEVLEAAYNLENLVERLALREQYGSRGIKFNIFNSSTWNAIDSLESDFQASKTKIDELALRKSLKQYCLPGAEPETSLPTVSPTEEDPDDVVGLGDDLNNLKSKLFDSNHDSQVTIVGMAGLGKTTLAKKLYNDPKVKEWFHVHAWARVSRESNLVTVAKSILENISGGDGLGEAPSVAEARSMLHKTLCMKRYLVILDDFWSAGDWMRMRQFFPDYQMGSRVVITTRNERVGRFINGEVVRMRFLKNEESEELFRKKLGLHPSVMKYVLADIYRNASLRSTVNTIISLCQGLPSEIIRFANILKHKELEDWDEVVHDMIRRNEIEETSLLKSIALSYDYLQPYIRPCFLYLGQFPPEQPIPVKKLYLMWMAEGLASNTYMAGTYLEELIDKNLVSVKRVNLSTGGLVTCQLRDVNRKLCILKGQAEGYVGIVDLKPRSIVTGRSTVYLNGTVKANDTSWYTHAPKHIRTLLFFSDQDLPLLSRWSGKFAEIENFEMTRILDFDGIDFQANKYWINTGKLVHLRYLGFARCYLAEFPASFWNFPYLETLDLRVMTKMIIPNILWKMSNLKHLFFPLVYECKTPEKLRLDKVTKLEVIENFHAGICDVKDLQHFKHIQTLKVISDGENIELRELISNVQKIHESRFVVKSSLVLRDFDCCSIERQETFKELLTSGGIQNLNLEGCIRKMPKNLKMAQNFTDILFDGTEFRKDPLPLLGKLEQLQSLALCNDATISKKISCRGKSFLQLRSFEINNLQSLMHWVMESESMPRLTVLTIKPSNKLVSLPRMLMTRQPLPQLNISSMPRQFQVIIEKAEVYQKMRDQKTAQDPPSK